MNIIYKQLIIPEKLASYRLDQALALLCPEFSRAHIQQWIQKSQVTVNGKIVFKPSHKVLVHQEIIINANLVERENWTPQNILLNIIYEDQDLIVINKPAGLVVHPGAGHPDQTLINSLLYYDPNLATIPRAGLVHRLDKDTSGLLVIARNISSHHYLVSALQARKITRIYQAVVHGKLISGGTINASLGRHPKQRTKICVKKQGGKTAITHYRIIKRFSQHTHVKIQLETGRTHQIRVHFAHINHAIVGDPTYGKTILPKNTTNQKLIDVLNHFNRQALHASELSLHHPTTGALLTWQSPLPDDMKTLIETLNEETTS